MKEHQAHQLNNDTLQQDMFSTNEKLLKQQQDLKEKAINKSEKNEESEVNFSDVLFKGISDAMLSITKQDMFKNAFEQLVSSGVLKSEDDIDALVSIISPTIIGTIFSSLVLYDNLLKDEINTQLDHLVEHINLSKSDIEAIKAVVQIHSKQLAEIQDRSTIDGFKKKNGIT